MSNYQPTFVVAEDRTVIALKFVESMNLSREESDLVADKLKGDRIIHVTTSSGNSYAISMQTQIKLLKPQFSISDDPEELRSSIFERWVSFINH